MLVTAGHCVQAWGVGHIWEHDSDRFGTGANDTLPPPGTPGNPANADADLGWIRIDSGESVTPANQFMAAGPTDVRSFTYIAVNAFQQEGDTVCRSGATTFWRCGQIINTAASKVNGEGHMITNVWVMNVDAEGGDSGGIYVEPQYNDSQGWRYPAAGVHVHSGDDTKCAVEGICRAWYSTAQDLETLTQLVICRSSSC